MFINSDIASYSIKKDALVLTNDSDFLVYDLKGVILLPRNFFREELYVYTRTKILDFLGFQEFQLHYYIMISGNDYTKQHPSKLRDGHEATVENTLDYIREVCKSKRECKEDYEEMYPENDAMEEFEMLEKLYSCKQVEIPWNCLTTDIDRVDEIKTKIPEGFDVSTKWKCRETEGGQQVFAPKLSETGPKLHIFSILRISPYPAYGVRRTM